ncbi:MAG TPA: heparan-alpha-glucosaminide N-acetyltransferase domain-containing protein [Flavitalea sp.]|nr:heparan-alpha-glucosaminide N-acetyltransferase domain-containing protein [Flavitalea sp.]
MPSPNRINSIDLLRGIVMIIMALDHTRDYFHSQALLDDPLNLQTTTPALFATRWITHLCAPTFVFLSGTSAYLQSMRKPKKQLSAFLITRGLWLILLEMLIMTLGITFDIHYHLIILQTIWAIGISMVLLGIVIWLPFTAIFICGLIIVLAHNSLDFYETSQGKNFPFFYSILHTQGMYPFGDRILQIFYPFLPWAGTIMLGYCFGKYYLHDIMNRNKRSILLGCGLILFFIILRFSNMYGDPIKWKVQPTLLYSFFSFISTEKYPPSLLYLCMTIGISLVLLGLIGNVKNKFADAITVYGRVPLFYYIIHFYILHLLSMLLFFYNGHSYEEGAKGAVDVPFKFLVPGEGFGLAGVYLVWLLVVTGLYPLCKWYSEYKRTHNKWWVSYV